jgi:hydrogenase maturation protease
MSISSIGIIGVGNPLRKDDGIGILLLEYIKKESNNLPETVSFVDGGTGGMNLLHIFNRFDVVIILDAVNFQGKPGETRFFTFDDISSQKQVSTVSTHNADLFQIIRIGQELDECPKKIFVFGVQPLDVSFGEGLTKPVQDQLTDIISSMKHHIFKLINEQN